jgi:hypothetical protein
MKLKLNCELTNTTIYLKLSRIQLEGLEGKVEWFNYDYSKLKKKGKESYILS